MNDEQLITTLAELQSDMKYVKRDVKEIRDSLKPSRTPVLPVTGGIVGVLAMVWTAYLQATGQG